ncbi:MAG: tetraacyldisaccharide 4'-kinase [Campylobacterales bacterium]
MDKTPFFDRYFYQPGFAHKLIAFVLLPVSGVYYLVSLLSFVLGRTHRPPIPCISIGNLIVGGSGKSPMALKIASMAENSALILRGYARESKGVVVVSKNGELLESLQRVGDEAYMLACEHKAGCVIVAENRLEGVKKAHKMGAKVAILDDGFRHKIEKLNILLEPQVKPCFKLVLPSGAYRVPPFLRKKADFILQDGVDYKRVVTIKNKTDKMLLLTAIANPARLDKFLPHEYIVGRLYYNDHSRFEFEEIRSGFDKAEATSLLVTKKDLVKLGKIGLPISVMNLDIEIVNSEFESSLKSFLHQID